MWGIWADFIADPAKLGIVKSVIDALIKICVSLFLSFLFWACGGCNPVLTRNYKLEHIDVGKKLTIPTEFEYAFHDCDHFITGYPSQPSQLWNSECFLYDRYILTCQIAMEYSSSSGWKKVKEAQFYLSEVSKVILHSGGVTEAVMGDTFEFGENEWRDIAKNGGDLNKSGFRIVTDSPVKNFRALEGNTRRPRIPISVK